MTSARRSALYLGRIRHRRRRDPEHSFSYGVWHALLDLDRVETTCAAIPLLSHNRFNLLSFHDRDHMRDEKGPVRDKLGRFFESCGLHAPQGRVLLLTGLRHLGFGFNPVSFYFCHGADNGLEHVVAEVNNTFGETYCYLLDGSGHRRVVRDRAAKRFHVSPFHPLEGVYRFRITTPGERLTIHMDLLRDGERVFDATLSSRRVPLSTRSLLDAVARHAHLSALTVGRIHWQALKLWLRGAAFHAKPPLPDKAWRTHHG